MVLTNSNELKLYQQNKTKQKSPIILRRLKNSIPVKDRDAARPHEGMGARIGKLPGFPFPFSAALPRSVLPVQNFSLFQSPGGHIAAPELPHLHIGFDPAQRLVVSPYHYYQFWGGTF